MARLPDPSLLSGIDRAVEVLADAIRQGRAILVVADFDADGATSCAVAVNGLQAMGAPTVEFLVPNRFQFGYGLTPEIVAVAATRKPSVIVTVDNGISSHDGVTAAKAHGWRVVITDHHLPGPELPDADAIVNPNLSGDRFPSKSIAGVGVVFYVLCALRTHLRQQGWFGAQHPEPRLADLLDLVALGTVADVVPFDHVNRIFVQQGLQRIRAGRARPGISALLSVAGKSAASLTAEDLGFAVAPRLNAAGRLEDMSLGIECLLCTESLVALDRARQLDELNAQRKIIERQMQEEAIAHIQAVDLDGISASGQPALCLFREDWHPGVIGLLASRLKERFHRPVVAFAGTPGGELKGSARSVPGLHIRDVLSDIATAEPSSILRFGGHAMAAGLTIEHAQLHRFRELLNEFIQCRMGTFRDEELLSDGELDFSRIDIATADSIRLGGPWGQAFPEPLFDGDFDVVERSVVGERHLKLVLRPTGGDRPVDGIAFFVENPERWLAVERIQAAFRLAVNEFRGLRSVQLKIDYMQGTPEAGDRAVRGAGAS